MFIVTIFLSGKLKKIVKNLEIKKNEKSKLRSSSENDRFFSKKPSWKNCYYFYKFLI